MKSIKVFISRVQAEFSKELANPMYLTAYIERMGTGTGDIIRKCTEAGLKAPEFIQDEDFRVIMWRTDQATDQAIAINKNIVQLVQLMDIPRKRAELQHYTIAPRKSDTSGSILLSD